MKKQMKKLTLAKETLVSLEKNLGQVAGGLTKINCESGYATCATCNHNTCGTNLC